MLGREIVMKYKMAAGLTLPTVGLGTWTFGGSMTSDSGKDEGAVEAIVAAIEMGYRHIDTAEMYGDGHAEELVSRGVRYSKVDRGELFITTKVKPSHASYDDLLSAADRSLSRLGTDYIDLYLIHWPASSVPLEESFRVMNRLVEEGKVRHLGVSNFDRKLLDRACRLSETPLVTNQVKYNLGYRKPEENGVLDYCSENDLFLTAYEPFDKGRLLKRESAIEPIAERFGATPAQIMIAWLLSKANVVTIPMSSSIEHLRSNLKAASIDLPPDVCDELEKLVNNTT